MLDFFRPSPAFAQIQSRSTVVNGRNVHVMYVTSNAYDTYVTRALRRPLRYGNACTFTAAVRTLLNGDEYNSWTVQHDAKQISCITIAHMSYVAVIIHAGT